jgi:hypothetical protein
MGEASERGHPMTKTLSILLLCAFVAMGFRLYTDETRIHRLESTSKDSPSLDLDDHIYTLRGSGAMTLYGPDGTAYYPLLIKVKP